jgi:hypothetical protein
MPYICQFEPIPSIVKTGTNFLAFGQCHGWVYVRRLFTRLSDVAPSFIVVDASFAPGIFAPGIFAPATVVCTQYLSLCTRYLEYLGFSPYPVTATAATEGPPHKTTIHGGINLSCRKERASFDGLYLQV